MRTRRDARLNGVPPVVAASRRSSGERRLADRDQHVVADSGGEYIVDLLKPGELGFQVMHALLKTTHLRNHARIRPADVTE
jgi:hypothetical protein